MHLSLRPGEKVYVNGAVLRADRKVSLEILNDVAFLMESHVMQAEQATTPLRQLYFVVQTMLVDPAQTPAASALFDAMYPRLLASFRNRDVLDALVAAKSTLGDGRTFEALKIIRAMFPVEDAILAGDVQATRAA
jgi:flagellar protein FlbT